MKITIHRGIDQIGGCITEITSAAGTRVLIDLGQNLPDGEGVVHDELATGEAVEALTHGVDAIFYTHYHGDHIGLFHLVPDVVTQYVGTVAKRVTLCKHRQLARIEGREQQAKVEIAKLEQMGELAPGYSVRVGDIHITPYFVSHSAYDSYMFLIEADGRRVLHTGDFRGHGYLSKALMPIIEKRILRDGPVDFLITEGTMLSRFGERVMSERELQKEAGKIMARHRNVFVMCSSTDMERLASFHAAHRRAGRGPLVCDKFQKKILTIFRDTAGKHSSLFLFDKVYDFRRWDDNVLDWMSQEGFCMFVRATDKFAEWWRELAPRLDPAETVRISVGN